MPSILTITLFFQAHAQELPNIVFYMADDQSQADGSVYGAKVLKTPTAEKLAKAGLTFETDFTLTKLSHSVR